MPDSPVITTGKFDSTTRPRSSKTFRMAGLAPTMLPKRRTDFLVLLADLGLDRFKLKRCDS